jgi:radical SAM protein (TIGR01212 family)
MHPKPYTDLSTYLRSRFGCRVQKITLDGGFTCPNRDGTVGTGGCIYCNARGSGTGAHARGLSVTQQLQAGVATVRKRYKTCKFIAYFQAFSNTYASAAKLRALYDEALAVPDVVGLSIGTRPDCVSGEVLDLLQGYASRCMLWVELGLQSIHGRTLRLINRGHDAAAFRQAAQALKTRGIKVVAHVILGLPGETRPDMLATADALAEMAVDGVKIHLLYVVKGTPLEGMLRRGEYRCLAQEEYVGLVCDVLGRLPASTVIHRLTGDPHPDELVEPKWALRKRETLEMIDAELRRRAGEPHQHLGVPPPSVPKLVLPWSHGHRVSSAGGVAHPPAGGSPG